MQDNHLKDEDVTWSKRNVIIQKVLFVRKRKRKDYWTFTLYLTLYWSNCWKSQRWRNDQKQQKCVIQENISLEKKMKSLRKSYMISDLLYGIECWAISSKLTTLESRRMCLYRTSISLETKREITELLLDIWPPLRQWMLGSLLKVDETWIKANVFI